MNARIVTVAAVQRESRNGDIAGNLARAGPQGGPRERWLAETVRRHGMHIGGSYLEARGDDAHVTPTSC